MEIQLTGVLVVAAGAFAVPLGLGFVTFLRLPSVVLEIVVGILIGPVVLRLVEIDTPLQILFLFMLAFRRPRPRPHDGRGGPRRRRAGGRAQALRRISLILEKASSIGL
jgi:hypothetical protein